MLTSVIVRVDAENNVLSLVDIVPKIFDLSLVDEGN